MTKNLSTWRNDPGFTVFIVGTELAIATALVFTLVPAIDLAVAGLFFTPGVGFLLNDLDGWRLLRTVFLRLYLVWYLVIVGCLIWGSITRSAVLSISPTRWLFLLLASVLGPWLLTNVILKEEWGRWRPREVIEFGGEYAFTAPLDWSGSCDYNCSFVSGEVSSMAMLVVCLWLVLPSWRALILRIGVVAIVLSAIIRIGQGGHFLSDTLLATAFMMMIAGGLHAVMFSGTKPLASDTEVDVGRVVALHDRALEKLAGWGLALLDLIAPRR